MLRRPTISTNLQVMRLHCPGRGRLTELLLKEFPEAHFNEEFQEWRIDWDEKAFPHQGQRLDAFATTHELEIFHRY